MRARRILLAAAAVALPLGVTAAVAGPQLASAGVTYFPITCAFGGTVTYTPALSNTGVVSSNPAANESVSVTGSLSGCLSSNTIDAGTTTGTDNLNLSTPPAKISKGVYATGRCADFASSNTLKALKGININITWAGQGLGGTGATTLLSKGGAVASNGSTGEAGFNIVLSYVSGDYTIKSGQATAFLNNTGAIAACATGGASVGSSTIDSSVSTLVG